MVSGACSCGRCKLQVEVPRPLADYSPRVCDCDYCQAHPSALLSDPSMRAAVVATTDSLLIDTQGDQLASFYRCVDCGTLLAVGAVIDGVSRGAVNAWLLDSRDAFAAPTPIQPRLLAAGEKVPRWRTLWGRLDIVQDR